MITGLTLITIFNYMFVVKYHESSINNNSINITSIFNKMFLINIYTLIALFVTGLLTLSTLVITIILMFLFNIGFNKLINILNNKDKLSLKDYSLDTNATMLFFATFIVLFSNSIA